MATASKAAKAAAPKPAEGGGDAPPKKSKKKLVIIVAAVVLLLGGGGAGGWFWWQSQQGGAPGAKKAEPAAPPVFQNMDAFTVNLQPETGSDQFLQVAFTLQVAGQSDVDNLKLYMPQVRSRILLLLSSKTASEISTVEGKKKLAKEIMAQITAPFAPNAPSLKVTDVFFTSFVIQ